ncbi:MAG: Kelch repeat-containing protein [Candidatus Odinarchaeota archaeon]
MKRKSIILLTSLMLMGLLGTASISQEAGTWTQKANMPTARFFPGSAVVDGKIYVIGGALVWEGLTSVAEQTSVAEKYDPAANTWTRCTDMPTTRHGLVAAAVDGIIYTIGGWDGDRELPTVEAYDPATDTWTTKASMPTARSFPAIVVVDGITYVIGGYFGPKVVSVVEAYDPAADKWTTKTDMPTARSESAACVIDGRIYVSSGGTKCNEIASDFGPVPTVEVYNPATDTWAQASDMPRTRMVHSASVVDGKMYIIGGVDFIGGELPSTVDVYDPATDAWTTAADLPTTRSGHAAGVVDGRIYVIGGFNGPGTPALSIVEEFDPGLPGAIPSVR